MGSLLCFCRRTALGRKDQDFFNERENYQMFTPSTSVWTWQTRPTTAKHSPGLYCGACASSGHYLYLYGGCDGSYCQISLYQLDTNSLVGPSYPVGLWLCHGLKLILVGRYGYPSGPTHPESEFTKDSRSDGAGWTNGQHMFNVQKGEERVLEFGKM